MIPLAAITAAITAALDTGTDAAIGVGDGVAPDGHEQTPTMPYLVVRYRARDTGESLCKNANAWTVLTVTITAVETTRHNADQLLDRAQHILQNTPLTVAHDHLGDGTDVRTLTVATFEPAGRESLNDGRIWNAVGIYDLAVAG